MERVSIVFFIVLLIFSIIVINKLRIEKIVVVGDLFPTQREQLERNLTRFQNKNFLFVSLVARRHDHAGARLLACTIDILKIKIMPSYTVTVTDAQDLALNTQMVGVGTYINTVIESQIFFAQSTIQNDLLKYCNENGVAMAVGVDAQVQQAFDVGIAHTLTSTPPN